MSKFKPFWAPHIAAALLGGLSMTTCDRVVEPGGAKSEIVGGSSLTSPQNYGHIWTKWGGPTQAAEERGSGTLVNSNTALTAAHVLNHSNCKSPQPLSGNALTSCWFVPNSHYMYLGNQGQSPASRQVDKIYVHPDYFPGGADTNIDVAIIKTNSPFLSSEGGNFDKTLYAQAAGTLVTAGTTLSLESYGCTSANLATCEQPTSLSIAHYAGFKPTSQPGVGNYELQAWNSATQTPGTWSTQHGDSGAPYMMPGSSTEIAAVHYRRDPITNQPRAVPAQRFRRWFELATDPNTLDSANGDAGSPGSAAPPVPPGPPDGVAEAFFLRRGLQFAGQSWVYVTVLFSNGTEWTIPMIPDLGWAYLKSGFVPGDFDDDGLPELVGQVTSENPATTCTSDANCSSGETCSSTSGHCQKLESFYFGSSLSNPSTFSPKTFGLASSVSQQFNVADFDSDGVQDLEILDFDNAWADVYYGSAGGGLLPGAPYYGLPSALGVDGKFITVSGVGMSTITFPKVAVKISIPASQPSFDVQIFDGDLSATNDAVGGGRTCYYLFADGDDDGVPPGWPSSPVYVAQAEDSAFPDHAWKSFYHHPATQAKHAAALAGTGNYIYTLSAQLVDGACGSTATTVASMNAFSVRADAEIIYPTDRIQFIAEDAAGEFAPGAGQTETRDTFYEGDVLINFLTTANFASELLVDADADDLADNQDPAGWYSCPSLCSPPLVDVQAPGVALGANTAIRYDIYGLPWDGSSFNFLGEQENVSGQYGPSAPQDAEAHTFQTGLWPIQGWSWTNVMGHNNVHLWSPKNATGGYYYPIGTGVRPGLARHQEGLHWAATLDPSEWVTGAYQSYLPITIGTGRNAVRAHDGTTADAILRRTFQPCGVPPVPALASLMAQLLAAKLNVASGSGVGAANLNAAKIYATLLRVGNTIVDADTALVICNPDSRMQDEMQAFASLLSVANQGFVDNRWE